jgi:heme-degrading monooxygenase HmoA
MVLEIADFTVKAGTEDRFAAAVQEGLPHVASTPGFWVRG